ncbi:hypothetical protein BG53_03955 [Paenibacillus darwinianus]|uniref:Uncharacterized protein n=1 Tax=Paenibacillus darwinianus TaxID=1380763 RepID=A0A9W5W729_9BACL|nr:hypothetical protein BG53_03955 [Paenibacillus darwinianus]EXX87564.1 hypothetical protein CH50_05130 [Paenibacillus darwinianus]EXX87697.1 hypothetical protein BG52_03620 [Paenibacillus darwinianus]
MSFSVPHTLHSTRISPTIDSAGFSSSSGNFLPQSGQNRALTGAALPQSGQLFSSLMFVIFS